MLLSTFFAPVVGAAFATARAPLRLKAIAECQPGDELQLRRERLPIGGHRAVGVYTASGDQLGYVHPPQAEEVASRVAVARAVFQRPDTFGAVIRVTLDGTTPTLPAPAPRPQRSRPPAEPVDQFCEIFPASRYAQRTASTDLCHSDKSRRAAGGREATNGEHAGMETEK